MIYFFGCFFISEKNITFDTFTPESALENTKYKV